jgi:flavin reductase (DIM6/NTAB) family NADH-FMN oxidoreductase RutF
MIGTEEFRRVMGHFATGVTVVTSRGVDGVPLGLTVNAFTSVSLDPLLVLVCIHRRASGHDALLESGHFAVNVLRRDQEELALRFSGKDASERFRDLPAPDGPLGSPLIPEALAWLECRIRDVFPGGDHSVVLGEVVGCQARDGEPLLFFQGRLMGLGG